MEGSARRLGPASKLRRLALAAALPWLALSGTHGQTVPPSWGEAEIRASRQEHPGSRERPAQPRWSADPMHLLLVIEAGDDLVSLVDGQRLERIHRFASRAGLRGEPLFSADGRYVYLASRDGWVSQYDLWNLAPVAEVRVGLALRNAALSGDGRWLMIANESPHTLVLLDDQLQWVKLFDAVSRDGRHSSRVASVHDAAPRSSFIVALQDLPELWEISYDPRAEDIYDGLVHDYRMGEGLPKRGFLGIRRTQLAAPLQDLYIDPEAIHAIGVVPAQTDGRPRGRVVNLDVRRSIATLPIEGVPGIGAAIGFEWNGRSVLAIPSRSEGSISVVETQDWSRVRTIPVAGPGLALRSHPGTPYAWADAALSPSASDTLSVIDKRTLAPVAQLREPGGHFAHLGFSLDARFALASLAQPQGALIVYDARSLREVRRLPMNHPVGSYSVGAGARRSAAIAR